ncbi:MAG TPA: hypothetical protein VEG27_08935 [Usitatibacter sp.]|nr:hypothetical protein [Usitatibacter sp.]
MIAYDDQELALAAELLELRHGRSVRFELGEAEVPEPGAPVPFACAALVWESRGAQFVVCKVGPARYRGGAFDASGDPLRGGGVEHSDLGDCIDELLRARSG